LEDARKTFCEAGPLRGKTVVDHALRIDFDAATDRLE